MWHWNLGTVGEGRVKGVRLHTWKYDNALKETGKSKSARLCLNLCKCSFWWWRNISISS